MSIAAALESPAAPEPLVTLWGPGHAKNPFPIYDRMRAQAAASKAYMADGKEVWVITRYDAVIEALKHPNMTVDRRRIGVYPPLLMRWLGKALGMAEGGMVGVDGSEHSRLRGLVQKAFTPRAIERLEGWITSTANRLLDEAEKKGEADLIADFALPLPLQVISEMLGVPEGQRMEFATHVSHLFNFALGTNILRQASSGLQLRLYIGKLIAQKRRAPDDRLMTQLIEAEESGDHLSEAELAGTVLLLLFAGHETTVNLIGNGMIALFDHPEQLAMLRANPSLSAQAVEEMLRFAPPVEYGTPRYAIEDVALDDVVIPRGDTAIALLSAAGRDARAFDRPNEFDIAREKNRQVTFGFGSHFCLGAPLARMEGAIAFRLLAERFPNMVLAAPRESLEWWNIVGLRGVKKLPVRFR